MDFNLLTGSMLAVLLGSFAAGVRYIRSWWLYISGYAIVRLSVDDHTLDTICEWLLENAKQSPFTAKAVGSMVVTRKKTMLTEWHAYYSLKASSLFWCGFRPIWVSGSKSSSLSSAPPSNSSSDQDRVVSFVRGTFDVDRLIRDAYVQRNNSRQDRQRFGVRRIFGREKLGSQPEIAHRLSYSNISMLGIRTITCDQDELYGRSPQTVLSIDDLSLTQPQLRLYEDFKQWLANRQWYLDRHIPWKFGATLFGPPGTGKTSFIRGAAIANSLPVIVFELATLSSQELVRFWDEIKSESPCICVFEDIDGVFNGTRPVKRSGDLTFDTFLQCLSGISECDGIAVFLTTNNLDDVAPALLRPGRAGRVVEFGLCNQQQQDNIAKRILPDLTDIELESLRIAASSLGSVSADKMTHLCVQVAMQLTHSTVLDRSDALNQSILHALQDIREVQIVNRSSL